MEMNSGIYAITNRENGKTYIGSTKDFKRRWGEHRDELRDGAHHNPHLQHAWNKYGEEVFQFTVCEYVEDLKQLIDCEQYWLDFHRMYVDVYNIALAVNWSIKSKETCLKMSAAAMGNQNALGCVRSKETRQSIGRSSKGRRHTEKTKREISEAAKGNQHGLGYKHTRKARQRISEAQIGRSRSKETKHRISMGMKRYWARRRAMGVAQSLD